MKIQRMASVMGAIAMAMAALPMANIASAAPGLKLDQPDISSKQCKPNGGGAQQLVDVHFTILNVADSGFGPSGSLAWANDTIDRHLRIYQLDDGSFCVNVADKGKFVTYAGDGPGEGTSILDANIKGEFEGGYVSNFFGATFTPTLPTRGNLGAYDMGCDRTFVCPGTRPSYLSYLSAVSGENITAEWGWIYRAGKHGTWLNQDDVAAADSGNIE